MPWLLLIVLLGFAAALLSTHSSANCGQAACAVNTDWEAQGVLLDGTTRLDVRAEYVDQDHRRRESEKVPAAEVTGHHDEVRTINRNWIATLDHSFNGQWGLSVALPYSSRTHHHVHHHQGEEAESDDSGGKFVFFSPGISVSASRNVRLYTFLQLPLYQYANGIQLASDWAASTGVSIRF
jgi:hypothetical protein